MSMKASTAALESSASRSLPNQRRAPRHPAGAKQSASKVKPPRNDHRAARVHVVQTAILREDAMNANNRFAPAIHYKTIVPVILRITFSLLLWTLGFASMNLVEAQVRPQRIVRDYPVDRAKLEHLHRWVNEGHDTWCRDPKLVASAALNRVAPGFINSEFELASPPLNTQRPTARSPSTPSRRSMAAPRTQSHCAAIDGCFP
ncbi:MAG TPA: hypothetical protein VGF61_25320 [Candidatus Acidoferrum sp.]|jgi:hypothetical protein